MALSFLITTFSFAMMMEPLARLVVIIIGSILSQNQPQRWGQRQFASNQSPSVRPLITKTTGTITNMSRIKSQDGIHFKWGWSVIVLMVCSIAPIMVSSPTTKTKVVARPGDDIGSHEGQAFTPRDYLDLTGFSETNLFNSITFPLWDQIVGIKKSREPIKTTSAGTASPALSLITFLRRFHWSEFSCSDPSRRTVAVLIIIYVIGCWQLYHPQFLNEADPTWDQDQDHNDDRGRWSCSPGFASQTLAVMKKPAYDQQNHRDW